jgi:predicted ArsR family transcriptional regulator
MSNYPHAPGFKAVTTETSAEAAFAIRERAKAIREKCLATISAYSEGLTSDEVAFRIGEERHNVRSRMSELKAQGKIVATNERRKNASGKNAVVWRIARKPEQKELAI